MSATLCVLAAVSAVLVIRPAPASPARLRRLARGSPGGQRLVRGVLRRTRRARARPAAGVSVAVLLDLVAEVVAAGAPPAGAISAVAGCLDPEDAAVAAELLALVAPTARDDGRPAGTSRLALLAAALELAVSTGAGPVGLIRAAAGEERRRGHAAAVQAARRAGVLVLLPTGLCLLPAFVLLTVVPLALDLLLG